MSGLTEASQIMSIITGATVVGGAAVAIFKWNAIIQMIVRIAQGHPDRQDIDNIEEGIATNPAVREAAATAQNVLSRAGLQRAARNVREVREHARNRPPGPQPVNIQLHQQPGRAVRVEMQSATRDGATNTSPRAPRSSPPRVRNGLQSGSPLPATNQSASQPRTSPPRVRNVQSGTSDSIMHQGDVETGFLPQRIRNGQSGAENVAPNPRPQEIQEYHEVQQPDPSIGSSSVLPPRGHGQTRERLPRGTPSSKGGKTSVRRPGARAGVTRESFKHNNRNDEGT
jgi:hypothetical protein